MQWSHVLRNRMWVVVPTALMYGGITLTALIIDSTIANAQRGCSGKADCANEPPPPPGHRLYVENDCVYPIRIAVHYQDWPSGKWVTDGWWEFRANESAYPSTDDGRIISISSVHYYFAQITTDGKDYTWRGGTENVKFLGDLELPMKEKIRKLTRMMITFYASLVTM